MVGSTAATKVGRAVGLMVGMRVVTMDSRAVAATAAVTVDLKVVNMVAQKAGQKVEN